MSRGISDTDWFLADDKGKRDMMMNSSVTEDGMSKVNDASERYATQLQKVNDIAQGVGYKFWQGGKKAEDLAKAEEKLTKIQLELAGQRFEDYNKQRGWEEDLFQANQDLIQAKEDLAKEIEKAGLGEAKAALTQANKDMGESEMAVGLAPAMKGVMLGQEMNTMMKLNDSMRGVQQGMAEQNLSPKRN